MKKMIANEINVLTHRVKFTQEEDAIQLYKQEYVSTYLMKKKNWSK